MPRALVALGGNLGDRERTLSRAIEMLRAHPQVTTLRSSRLHETAPIGGPAGQGLFLNAAVSFETTLGSGPLHLALGEIEHALGRQRGDRWEARTIDLDLLLYGDEVVATGSLVVPHPRMAFRRFVLEAAVEVAADMVHPTIGWTLRQLLAHLDTAERYVALLGLPGSGQTALAQKLASLIGGRLIEAATSGFPPPSHGDPPSHVSERQIQFLDRWASLLASPLGLEPGQVAVSDFYFDQCLAYARTELDDRAYEAFCAAWSAVRPQVVAPKLLVVLDAGPLGALPPCSEEGRHATSLPPIERLRCELLRVAARPGLGPVLYAGRENPRAQFDEISSAIAAME